MRSRTSRESRSRRDGPWLHAPALRYTPAERAARVASSDAQGAAGVALAIAGALLVGGGTGMVVFSEVRRRELEFDDRRALITLCHTSFTNAEMLPAECFGEVIPEGTSVGSYMAAIDEAQRQFNSDVNEFNTLSAIGYVMIGVGAASLLASVVLFVTRPSEEDTTTIRVGVGPSGVQLTGTF